MRREDVVVVIDDEKPSGNGLSVQNRQPASDTLSVSAEWKSAVEDAIPHGHKIVSHVAPLSPSQAADSSIRAEVLRKVKQLREVEIGEGLQGPLGHVHLTQAEFLCEVAHDGRSVPVKGVFTPEFG
jgi:hypothetical protein